jgi:inner membrane protein involved in colicin E2 resistance
MHPKQYLLVGLACVSFAALLLMWLIEPTLGMP